MFNFFLLISILSTYIECPKSTSNMAWIDARAVKLGCIGFSKTMSYRSRGIRSETVCKKANSKAHLIEIFNDKQSRFLISEKVRKQVRTHIGIDTYSSRWWWIGAELKSGEWYWTHSKKRVTYWSKIGGNGNNSKRYRYVMMLLSRTTAYFHHYYDNNFNSICQISINK